MSASLTRLAVYLSGRSIHAANVAVYSDPGFLHNSISVYVIDTTTGLLTTMGQEVRGFVRTRYPGTPW
jgi:hypothetical protein